MPNIFICGYEREKAEDLKKIIDEVMKEMKLQHDAITSVVDMKTESCDGIRKSMPYLRICSTDKAQISEIIKSFRERKLEEDVEWIIMDGFIPAYEMRKGVENG